MKLRRSLCALLCAGMLLTACALAEPAYEMRTQGQEDLTAYLARVNACLAEHGLPTVNSCFGWFEGLAIWGITQEDDAEIPENVEMTFSLYRDSINKLELRVTDPDAFVGLAAACLCALDENLAWQDAQSAVYPYARQVGAAPDTSFEDPVIEMNGMAPRTYFAYYPNQFQDGISWLQMTVIFAIPGSTETIGTTPVPTAIEEDPDGYNDIRADDNYIHLEVYATPTPEPESPAGEWLSGK